LNSVALNAIDQLWALSNKMDVTIKHQFDSDELWTHAEPDLLERAILNLLSNAIKHSEPGSVVNVEISHTPAEIICCVIDKGDGISVDELPFDVSSIQGEGSSFCLTLANIPAKEAIE